MQSNKNNRNEERKYMRATHNSTTNFFDSSSKKYNMTPAK